MILCAAGGENNMEDAFYIIPILNAVNISF